ncbi:MAG: hypothetical protein ABFS12_10360, partial [Bacteroidota bacterium]
MNKINYKNKIFSRYLFVILYSLINLIPLTLVAQTTGYSDSFDGEMKVTAPPSFELNQENGLLNIRVRKETSKTWQAVNYDIGSTIDITAHPYVNVRLKADKPILLTVKIFDYYFVGMGVNIKVYPSDEFVDYLVDFSGSSSVTKAGITNIEFIANGNSIESFNAELIIDDLKMGSDAIMLAGIGAVDKQTAFINSNSNSIQLLDINNSNSLSVSSNEQSIINLNISEINNRIAELSYDCSNDFTGEATLNVVVNGVEGYIDNSLVIPIEVEGNVVPTVDEIPDQAVVVGDTILVKLEGISDGNVTVEQQLNITASSNNQEALPDSNITIDFKQGLSVAALYYKVEKAANNIEVNITLDDQYKNNNITQKSFLISSYTQLNNPPTIDNLLDKYIYFEDGEVSIPLTGIFDGDDGTQQLSISATSSNNNVIHDSTITVNYLQGLMTAELILIPTSFGTTTITVFLQDNGGNASNNGDGIIETQFNVEVALKPVNGHSADFTSFNNWGLDQQNGQQSYELGTFKGKDNVIKIVLKDKSCWTGTIYNAPEMNLDQHRYLSYEIYMEGESFNTGVGGRTHTYLYDDGWDPDVDRNLPGAHEQRKVIMPDQWQTVFIDFRSEGGMDNNNGDEIDVTRIQKVLFNYASNFTWPFPIDNGTVYIANLKIGNKVPDSLITGIQYQCTIASIPNQTIFVGTDSITIQLTGISDGRSNSVALLIVAESSDSSFIPNPVVSSVDNLGKAKLTYLPSDETGRVYITVKVSAEGSIDRTTGFYIDIVSDELNKTVDIDISPGTQYQTMRGFGTFQFSDRESYVDMYTEELGASAVRIGIISNQIEPVNDNSDPDILNLDGYNHNAFNFDYYKNLKEKGVETFILTSWSPPAWMKRNLSVDYGYASAPEYSLTDNILEPYYYNEFAESMVAVVKMFKIKANIDLYAIGIQNEPAFTEPYASAVLSPGKFTELIEIVGKRFEREGITTKLYMPEQVFTHNHYSMADYVNALKARPNAEKYVDIIATHGYAEDGIQPGQPSFSKWQELWNESQGCLNPKELWMTETDPDCNNWNDAMSFAGSIHGAVKYGNVSLWTLWNIEGTMLNTGEKLKSFSTSQNYYKFVRPGAQRIEVTSGHEDILVTAFLDNKNARIT